MKIDSASFQKAFVQRAQVLLEKADSAVSQSTEPAPVDEVSLSGSGQSSGRLSFQGLVTGLAVSTAMGGVPGLAALAQEVARGLISDEQEAAASVRMTEQFLQTLPKVEEPRVAEIWSEIAKVTDSPFQAPLVFQSGFLDAQADARTIMLGTESLNEDLSDDSVLAFTLAHEEGHRRHRDTAGAAGLQALFELCQENDELYGLAFKAMAAGRRHNERQADQFAARAMTELGYDKQPVLEFLEALPGDMQHPPGPERADLVQQIFSSPTWKQVGM